MNGAGWVLTGAASFLGTHFILSHPLRQPLVRALGEKTFSALYSGVAFVTLGATIWAYRAAPVTSPWWAVSDGLWAVSTAAMLLASILLMGSFIGNPALPGGSGQAATAAARGVFAVTRHPMMWSFALWGASHILIYPVAKNMVLCGAIILLALIGATLQDRKKAALDPRGGPPGSAGQAICRSPRSCRSARRLAALARMRCSGAPFCGSARPGRIFRSPAGRPVSGGGCRKRRIAGEYRSELEQGGHEWQFWVSAAAKLSAGFRPQIAVA